jgi:hypothetical protein
LACHGLVVVSPLPHDNTFGPTFRFIRECPAFL